MANNFEFFKFETNLKRTKCKEQLAEITPEMLAEEIDGYNETILECKKHIGMHVVQREKISDLKEEAKNDLHVSFELKMMLFFIDTG